MGLMLLIQAVESRKKRRPAAKPFLKAGAGPSASIEDKSGTRQIQAMKTPGRKKSGWKMLGKLSDRRRPLSKASLKRLRNAARRGIKASKIGRPRGIHPTP